MDADILPFPDACSFFFLLLLHSFSGRVDLHYIPSVLDMVLCSDYLRWNFAVQFYYEITGWCQKTWISLVILTSAALISNCFGF